MGGGRVRFEGFRGNLARMSVSFGDLVRRGRETAGLSQTRLASLVGKSPTTIRAWEHGRVNPADREAVAAIAAVLGLDESELLGQAGFEATEARPRPSARQELTSLATERTEMMALAPPDARRIRPTRPAHSDPLPEVVPVGPDAASEPAPEDEMVVMPVITASIPAEAPPAVATAVAEAPPATPPKPRVVVTQPIAPVAPQVGSNGFVTGRSYIEDVGEKDFYRRRAAVTVVALAAMVIVVWWAMGRTGSAIGDFIESIFGSLDI